MNSERDKKEVVIVTGSSGLIGTAVIDALRERYQVVGFDKDGQPQPPPQVECICVDLTDPKSVCLGMQRVRYAYGNRIASVIHLAAYYDFSGKPSDLYEEVTVQGTRRLIEQLQQFEVEQFLFSSTMLVHHPTQPGQPIREESPLQGKWDYPSSKLRTERVIAETRGSIPATILRIAGVYTDTCDSIPISHQIQRVLEQRLTSHVYPGDTSHGQAFVHLDDLVDAIERSVEARHERPDMDVILIGEPETFSYEQIQQSLGELLHGEPDWSTESIPKSVAETGAWIQNKIPGIDEPFIKPWMIDMADDHYELDISHARERLGWSPPHRLIDTLPKMIRKLRSNPQEWYDRHGLEAPGDLDEIVAAPASEREEIPAGRS